MVEVYKMLSGMYDEDAGGILRLCVDSVPRSSGRGNSKKLFHQQWRKLVRGRFFSVRVAGTWNKLPESVVCAPSLNSFKRRLDELWELEPIRRDHRAPEPAARRSRYIDLTIEA